MNRFCAARRDPSLRTFGSPLIVREKPNWGKTTKQSNATIRCFIPQNITSREIFQIQQSNFHGVLSEKLHPRSEREQNHKDIKFVGNANTFSILKTRQQTEFRPPLVLPARPATDIQIRHSEIRELHCLQLEAPCTAEKKMIRITQ